MRIPARYDKTVMLSNIRPKKPLRSPEVNQRYPVRGSVGAVVVAIKGAILQRNFSSSGGDVSLHDFLADSPLGEFRHGGFVMCQAVGFCGKFGIFYRVEKPATHIPVGQVMHPGFVI